MIFNRIDKQYEEAGRDDEKFERLLRQAQKDRLGVVIIAAVIILGLLALVVWFSQPLIHGLDLMRAGRWSEADEAMKPITHLKDLEPALISSAFGIFFALSIIMLLVRETYVRVNMLLLFRGLRDRERANPQG
jgi:hypothetical protein